MKNISEKKTIDVTGVNFSPIATFKQGDAAVLKLELFKNGEVFNITGQTVKLGAYRPNKTIVEQLDGFTIDNNALTINLKNNILAVHGIVEVDLTLTDSTGEMTTASFYLKVNKKVLGSDNIAASDEIDSLKQIKIDLTALNENVKSEENTRIANEKIRVSEEKTRKANETERTNFYENVAKPIVEDLKDYDSQITKNTKNIADNTKDIERAFDTINDGSFLPFEGGNVTIEHSKVGFTKEMQIESMTYQNLIKSKTITVLEGQVYSDTISKVDLLKGGKTYTIIYNITKAASENERCTPYFNNKIGVRVYQNTQPNYNTTIGIKKWVVTFEPDFIPTHFCWWTQKQNAAFEVKDFMILEGDYSNSYIPPYFEGIKSVGEVENRISILSNGKNLFNAFNVIEKRDYTNRKVAINIQNINNLGFIPTATDDWSGIAYKLDKLKTYYIVGKCELFNCRSRVEKDKANVMPINDNIEFKTTINNSELFSISGLVTGSNPSVKIHYLQISCTDDNYEPYKEDKKEFLLPYSYGHKGFPNGAKDTFKIKEDGLYAVQKVERIVLDENKGDWTVTNGGLSDRLNTLYFSTNLLDNVINPNGQTLCDKFSIGDIFENDIEGYHLVALNYNLRFSINRNKLETPDIAGFKKWLQSNQITVYYELATPVEHKIADLNSINLKTFKDTTHVFSENSISPSFKFKAPVNVPATISSLRIRNESLEQENKELKEEVNTKTLKLHGQDVELTNSDLDLDFRIFELEMSIGLPINLNMKGMRNMARSPFEMMKILVLNNNYDREDIEYKASRYLQGKRMTQDEYDEIISLMDANELVK